MKLINIIVGLSLTLGLTTSCEDFLTTNPTSSLVEEQVVEDITGAKMLLQGTYRMMRDGNNLPATYSPLGIGILSVCSGVDMMINEEQVGNNWYFYTYGTQRYEATSDVPVNMWANMYKIISNANILIGSIDNVQADETVKNEIKGQALALRARCYFNLVRFYQHTYSIAKDKPGVPLQLEPSLEPQPRSTVAQVYDQILKDLTSAETLLVGYSRPSKDYYDKDVVSFLLANVYLTMNDWAKAETYANKIRTSYQLMSIDEYKAGFSTINKEWVLGYQQTSQDYWWYDSPACWYDFGQNNSPWQAEQVLPSNYFVEEIMKDDPRNLTIPNPIYEGKYAATKFIELRNESPYGDLFDMRAAEMYLVEAEAAARQGKTQVAKEVLNTLQTTRGAAVTEATGQSELLDAILLERRKEMWGEGIDLFDILRLQKPVVRTVAQGHFRDINIPANSNKLIMMIPEKEVINNDRMEQNPNPSTVPVFVP